MQINSAKKQIDDKITKLQDEIFHYKTLISKEYDTARLSKISEIIIKNLNSKKPSKFITEQSSIFTTNYNLSDLDGDEDQISGQSPTKSMRVKPGFPSATTDTEMIDNLSDDGKSSVVYLSKSEKPVQYAANTKIRRLRRDIIAKGSLSISIKWQAAIFFTIAMMILCKVLLKAYYTLAMDDLALYQTRINMMASILRPSGFFLRGCTVRLIELEKGIDKSQFRYQIIYYRDHNIYFFNRLKEHANVLIESFQTHRTNFNWVLESRSKLKKPLRSRCRFLVFTLTSRRICGKSWLLPSENR